QKLLKTLSDEEVLRAFADVGGHSLDKMIEAYDRARHDPDVPYLVIAHTIKGWGLESAAHPANHSTLPSEQEIGRLLEKAGRSMDDPFAPLGKNTEEGAFLRDRRDQFRRGIEEHLELRQKNREWVRSSIAKDG